MRLFGASRGTTSARDTDARQAFERMLARDWDRFDRFALHQCRGNRDDAEDLLSESMIDAFRAFASFNGQHFDRWFFRILTTNRLDMIRRQKVRHAESLDSGGNADDPPGTRDIPDTAPSPARLLEQKDSQKIVHEALSTLSEEFRAAILLCDLEGMDYAEIAQTLHIPLGTVRSRLHRGRLQLRRVLEARGWPG